MSADHQVESPDHSLSIEEAAESMGISPATIRRRIKTGELAAFKRTTPYGFEWRIGAAPESIGVITTADQPMPTAMQSPDQVVESASPIPDGVPEAIKALTDTLEHLREDHRAEIERIERDKEAFRQAAEHWQARFIEEHERVLHLLPAPKDEPTDVTPTEPGPDWQAIAQTLEERVKRLEEPSAQPEPKVSWWKRLWGER